MRFVCPDGEPQYRPYLERSASTLATAGHSLEFYETAPADDGEWVDRLAEADGLLLIWRLPSGVLSKAGSVRVVSFAGTGVENYVDLPEAEQNGVTVCNVPEYAANAVAEQALALILAVARQIPQRDRAVRDGEWSQSITGVELAGNRLGVVGAGAVGARMIEIAKALGMDVLAWTRNPSTARAEQLGVPLVSLTELFSGSRVVSLHVSYTPETHGLISSRLIRRLPRGSILVNTARGGLIEDGALQAGLVEGMLAGVGLDVHKQEPPAPGDDLLQDSRVIWSPHVGFATENATRRLISVAAANLAAYARGFPENVVTDNQPRKVERT
jgi:phosphoglycerate dehydrogenase-like enzyme